MDDLSEEENEIEDQLNEMKNRGYSFLIPIGRQLTLQEEKNDQVSSDSSDGASEHSGAEASNADEGENVSGADLDANIEDMDAQEADQDGEEQDDDYDNTARTVDASDTQPTNTRHRRLG